MTARILILLGIDAVFAAGLAWGWDAGVSVGILMAVFGGTAAVLVRNQRDLNELYGARASTRSSPVRRGRSSAR